jgi:hypothetical protein
MKRLVLAVGVLTTASSSYALELHNATILEHRSWISGSDNNVTIVSGYLKNDADNNFSSATTGARADNARGGVNSNIYTNGSHSFSIYNTSGSPQIYTVDIKLCANSTYCFHDQTRVNVSKGGSYSNSASSNLTCMFSYAGNYTLEATSTISGDTSSSTSGRATIYVSK